jgi:hypothetical protein
LDIRGIELSQNVNTRNYSTNINSHYLQFTAARAKPSQASLFSPVDVPQLSGSYPRRLAAISLQTPTLLTAISGLSRNCICFSLYSLSKNRTENTFSKSFSIVACVCGGHYLATAVVYRAENCVKVHFGNLSTVVTGTRLECCVRPAWQQNDQRLYLEIGFSRRGVDGQTPNWVLRRKCEGVVLCNGDTFSE